MGEIYQRSNIINIILFSIKRLLQYYSIFEPCLEIIPIQGSIYLPFIHFKNGYPVLYRAFLLKFFLESPKLFMQNLRN